MKQGIIQLDKLLVRTIDSAQAIFELKLRLGLGSWDGDGDGDEKVSGGCVEARRWRQWVRGGGGGLCEEEMPVAERGRGNDAGGGKEKATSWESGWMERQMRNFAGW
uniref:Uncharacterized protein n=1 Tax=Oryza glaberrima TaxID=4538 RepID=I1QAH8_ORYGL